jgi:hypothetical protein
VRAQMCNNRFIGLALATVALTSAMGVLPAPAKADPSHASMSAVQSTIRDIRDRLQQDWRCQASLSRSQSTR